MRHITTVKIDDGMPEDALSTLLTLHTICDKRSLLRQGKKIVGPIELQFALDADDCVKARHTAIFRYNHVYKKPRIVKH